MKPLSIVIATCLAALLLGVAGAQDEPLPEAAEQALEQGREAMNEALSTYEAHYPDRALWQEAFRHGRRALTLAPEREEPLRFLAEAYSRANWYGPAWNAWADYLERGFLLDAEATPLFTSVGSEQAYNLYRQGRLEDAADVYRQIIDAVPFYLDAHIWLGRILMEMDRPEAAISYWQTVVDRNPGDDRARYFLELARDQAQWGSEAVNAFREGVGFFEQGEIERARERFARATSLNPEYAEAWAWLGRVAFERGNYQDARTYYGNASRRAPGNETYQYFYEESQRRMEGAAQEASPDEEPAEASADRLDSDQQETSTDRTDEQEGQQDD